MTQVEALINLGKNYLNEGFSEFAVDAFTQAIDLDPKSNDIFNLRGIAYGMTENYNESIADFNVALVLNPDSGAIRGNRGLSYYYLGLLDKAIDDFNAALKLSGNKNIYFSNRGLAWLDYSEYDKANANEYLTRAIADFSTAMVLGLIGADVYENRGEAYLAIGDEKKALADFNRAIAIDPNNIDAEINKIMALSKISKRYEENINDKRKSSKSRKCHSNSSTLDRLSLRNDKTGSKNLNSRVPPVIWEEVDQVMDLQGHGAAVYYGPESDRDKSLPVAFLKDLEWFHSSSYNVVVEILNPHSIEYFRRKLDGHSVSREIQIAIFGYLQDRKFSGSNYISEHLWVNINA